MRTGIVTEASAPALAVVLLLVVSSCVSTFVESSAPVVADEQESDVSSAAAGGSSRRRRAAAAAAPAPLMVPITILQSAVAQGAVCLDGSPPAYHLDRGFGAGNNNWIVFLEGGGWCNSAMACKLRGGSRFGSSNLMERAIAFTGILSNRQVENPDFYNWNRVRVRYCDGASFAGDGYDKTHGVYFRGERIWDATVRHLLSIGMASANHALLAGCSSGGLASILHCDKFRAYFPPRTTVKCFADAGLFLDATDVVGARMLRSIYSAVVATQNVAPNLPSTCTSRMDATSCFFPQNVIDGIKTPIFLLNSAYDSWQIQESLAPNAADANGTWQACKSNIFACNANQIKFLQDFRNQMVASVTRGFSRSRSNGLFIDSCFGHCQSESPNTWNNAPAGPAAIQNKGLAKSFGDWCFDRAEVKAIDCPFPCNSCRRH